MSGTSLDGLDVALCRIRNSGSDTQVSIENFHTVEYANDFKAEVLSIFSRRQINQENLCLLNEKIGVLHGEMVLGCLSNWQVSPQEIDLIASHGQTVYHAPKTQHGIADARSGSLQIGDADHLATVTGIVTCSDFRQKHLAVGGDGAPLVIYGDYYTFTHPDENRILLNLGGIANITCLPAGASPEQVIGTDVGPGNILMDVFVREHFPHLNYDKDATIARRGSVSGELLAALRQHPFFDLDFPKTTGPELFNLNFLTDAVETSRQTTLSNENQLATLNEFSATSIVRAIQILTRDWPDYHVYASGGGIHNELLIDNIRRGLNGHTIESTSVLGVDPDAKEALLFAILANECVAGSPIRFGYNSPELAATTLGKISFPH